MRIIAIQEKDIKALMDKMKLTELEIKFRYKTEHVELADKIHRSFHYDLVNFFQEQGSNYPNG